jgi:hypothetical protein
MPVLTVAAFMPRFMRSVAVWPWWIRTRPVHWLLEMPSGTQPVICRYAVRVAVCVSSGHECARRSVVACSTRWATKFARIAVTMHVGRYSPGRIHVSTRVVAVLPDTWVGVWTRTAVVSHRVVHRRRTLVHHRQSTPCVRLTWARIIRCTGSDWSIPLSRIRLGTIEGSLRGHRSVAGLWVVDSRVGIHKITRFCAHNLVHPYDRAANS